MRRTSSCCESPPLGTPNPSFGCGPLGSVDRGSSVDGDCSIISEHGPRPIGDEAGLDKGFQWSPCELHQRIPRFFHRTCVPGLGQFGGADRWRQSWDMRLPGQPDRLVLRNATNFGPHRELHGLDLRGKFGERSCLYRELHPSLGVAGRPSLAKSLGEHIYPDDYRLC